MGQRELLETLRREGDEQAAALRQAAGQQSQQLRDEAREKLRELKSEQEERRKQLCLACRRDVLAEAQREAALVRLRKEHDLALRLRQRAAAGLEGLRRGGGDTLFDRLAAELPREAWGAVRVNPLDATLAVSRFPGVAVQADDTVRGGLAVVTADGDFSVVNTLEARLERSWPELLPRIMAEVRGRRP